jgi:hypothetical protein
VRQEAARCSGDEQLDWAARRLHLSGSPTSQPLIGTYLACNTRFVISDIRSHPAKPQGTANDASLKLLADFSRGIATRIARNATTANSNIVTGFEYILSARRSHN